MRDAMAAAEYIRQSPLWPSECLDGLRDDDGDVWMWDGAVCWLAGDSRDFDWCSFGLPDLDHAGTRAMLLEHLSKVTGWSVGTARTRVWPDMVQWAWVSFPLGERASPQWMPAMGEARDTPSEALLDAWRWAERRAEQVAKIAAEDGC